MDIIVREPKIVPPTSIGKGVVTLCTNMLYFRTTSENVKLYVYYGYVKSRKRTSGPKRPRIKPIAYCVAQRTCKSQPVTEPRPSPSLPIAGHDGTHVLSGMEHWRGGEEGIWCSVSWPKYGICVKRFTYNELTSCPALFALYSRTNDIHVAIEVE